MNTSELVTYVKRAFGDESGVQLTDEDILRWINAAQRQTVLYSESLLQTSTTQNISSGVAEYTLPSNLLVLRSIRIKMSGMLSYAYIEPKNLQEFDKVIGTWDGTAWGEARPHIYAVHATSIFLFPTPDANATDGLKILYSRRPTDLTSTSDSIDLPEQYHNAIIKYCLMQANELDEDYEAGAIHQAQYMADIQGASFQQQYGARETYPTITVLPEDLW